MATNYLNLIGKARFIKHVYTPDEAFGASKFKAGIYLDDENLNKFKKSGIQVGIKSDENGDYIVLSRDEVKMINKNLVYFTPPYIKAKDTTYLVSYVDDTDTIIRQFQDPNMKEKIKRVGDPFLIGNGSLVELNVCIFDTKTKGKGHRLEGLRILDLIEYRPQSEAETPQETSKEEKPEPVAEVEPKSKSTSKKAPW